MRALPRLWSKDSWLIVANASSLIGTGGRQSFAVERGTSPILHRFHAERAKT